ncbi:MAG: hypothetical protein J3K34DRAFT_512478 [Monoraphidium minutum]|nr:MAG: hypothetical protein J3K34DRAFT_512478 [Monoraphidium minutum]
MPLAPVQVLAGVSAFPNRQAARVAFAVTPCSLVAEPGRCRLRSVYAEGRETIWGGLLMTFGESRCRVQLTGCSPGACYSALDLTAAMPADASAARPAQLLRGFRVLGGGRGGAWRGGGGVWVAANSSVVDLEYSTVTCDEFYRRRGRTPQQLCSTPFEGLSDLGAGLWSSRECPAAE